LGAAQHFARLDQCSWILATQYRQHIFTNAAVDNGRSFLTGVMIWAFAKNSRVLRSSYPCFLQEAWAMRLSQWFDSPLSSSKELTPQPKKTSFLFPPL
jgi:hypothetical protein